MRTRVRGVRIPGRAPAPAGAAAWPVLGLLLLLLLPGGLAAQEHHGVGIEEIRLVREAEEAESAGDLDRAVELLEDVLAESPASVPAILGMERVLRAKGRLDALPAHVKAMLREDPGTALGHQILVRAYAELNDEAGLEEAGAAWVAAAGRVETPYRELARIWTDRGDLERAIRMLEQGRAALGRAEALALELGDLHAQRGDGRSAAAEWQRAIGPEGQGAQLVRRRLSGLPDGGASILPHLIDLLEDERRGASAARQRVAVDLAIDAGLEPKVQELAPRVVRALRRAERQSFLLDVARKADGAGLHHAAYWAYTEALSGGGDGQQMLAVRGRAAELALVVGDTLRARQYYEQLEAAYAPGSAARRAAAARRIELLAGAGHLSRALRDFERFRQEFGEGPDLDRVAAALAGFLLARGDEAGAEALLEDADGARASLVRGRIALRRGDVAAARTAFLSAAPSLQGAEATEAIALATLLGRLSEQGGSLIGKALVQVGGGDAAGAVATLESGAADLPGPEAAPVLDFAAGLADRFRLVADAERVRRRIVDEHATSREAPGAMLALARSLLRQPDGIEEAQGLLEQLVVEHPRSALAPQARRELDRLRGR